MITALIFDFDGTILDTESGEFEAWRAIYREHGVTLDQQEWLRGVGAIGAFDPMAHLRALSGREIEASAESRARVLHQQALLQEVPRPGVLTLIDEARAAGVMTAVASSASHSWVDGHLNRLGLFDLFDTVICRDDVAPGRAKPHPDLYQLAVRMLGVDVSGVIAIEDSLNGMRAAQAAGIFTVVTPNPVTALLDFSGADSVLASLDGMTLARLSQFRMRG